MVVVVVVVVVIVVVVVVVVVAATTVQETSSLVDCVSALILVKSLEVKESVILHVIVEPSDTDWVIDVSVANEATVKFAEAVTYAPSSILYSTFT